MTGDGIAMIEMGIEARIEPTSQPPSTLRLSRPFRANTFTVPNSSLAAFSSRKGAVSCTRSPLENASHSIPYNHQPCFRRAPLFGGIRAHRLDSSSASALFSNPASEDRPHRVRTLTSIFRSRVPCQTKIPSFFSTGSQVQFDNGRPLALCPECGPRAEKVYKGFPRSGLLERPSL
jgi:hypothetical protein